MTLRARLTLFFIGIVVVPLLAATILLQVLISRETARQAEARLEMAAAAVGELWEGRLREARAETRLAAARVAPRIGTVELAAALENARGDGDLDFLVITSTSGGLVASAVSEPMFRAQIPSPTAEDLAAPGGFPGAVRAQVPVVTESRRVTLTGGWYADSRLVRELSAAAGMDVAVVGENGVLASTLPRPPEAPPVGREPVPVEGGRLAMTTRVAGQGIGVLLVGPGEVAGSFPASLWFVVLAGVVLAVVLGFFLARMISEPLQHLAEGARAVASGDLEHRVQAEGQDFAKIAEAFNVMTANLQTYVGELQQSRDELRRGLERLGVTLRSTHDLEAMLGVILDTAAVTLRARAGALYLLHPGARELRPEVAVGYEPPDSAALHLREGVAGTVAASGRPVLMGEPDGGPTPLPPRRAARSHGARGAAAPRGPLHGRPGALRSNPSRSVRRGRPGHPGLVRRSGFGGHRERAPAPGGPAAVYHRRAHRGVEPAVPLAHPGQGDRAGSAVRAPLVGAHAGHRSLQGRERRARPPPR